MTPFLYASENSQIGKREFDSREYSSELLQLQKDVIIPVSEIITDVIIDSIDKRNPSAQEFLGELKNSLP